MGTPTFQRRTTTRIKAVAPSLKFVAFYHRDEDRLNACMHDYEDRAFIYILTSRYDNREYFLYVGKTKAQYARNLTHCKKYAYDHVYLFECEPGHLTSCEAAVIKELCPIYNLQNNPRAEQFRMLLGINYTATQDAPSIHRYLARYAEYEKKGLFGFSLPMQVFSALEETTANQGYSCSELVQRILEKELGERITAKLQDISLVYEETNLINTKEYAQLHGKSREQVKAYLLQQNRIQGTAKIGRDWVITSDAKFPQDLRAGVSKP